VVFSKNIEGDAMKRSALFTLSSAFVLALGLVSYSTSSFALGTADERAACTPDVFRLCSSEIPSVSKIIACMKAKKSQLSPKCRAAFNPPKTETVSAKTRSMASDATEWCDFHGVEHNPEQQNWLKWCGDYVRK
jgi:hypothetical protein